MPFPGQKYLILIKSNSLTFFNLINRDFGIVTNNLPQILGAADAVLYFSSTGFIFKSVMHFECILVYDERRKCRFTFFLLYFFKNNLRFAAVFKLSVDDLATSFTEKLKKSEIKAIRR